MPKPIDVFIHTDDVPPTPSPGFQSFVAPLAPAIQQVTLNTTASRPIGDAWCEIIGGLENILSLHQIEARPAGQQVNLIISANPIEKLSLFVRVHFSHD